MITNAAINFNLKFKKLYTLEFKDSQSSGGNPADAPDQCGV